MWVNQTTRYLDLMEYEPSLKDYSDLKRWDKWFSWDKKRNLACCFSKVDRYDGGRVIYKKALRSERWLA